MRIYTDNLDSASYPLYHRYPLQTSQQPAYVYINLRAETLGADWDAEVGGAVTMDVWDGHTQRFSVSPHLHAKEVRRLLEEVRPLATKLLGLYSAVWDGNNTGPRFADPGKALLEEIADLCSEAETVTEGVLEAAGYLSANTAEELGVRASMTDDEIKELATALEEEAELKGYGLWGAENYLLQLRDDLAEEEEWVRQETELARQRQEEEAEE